MHGKYIQSYKDHKDFLCLTDAYLKDLNRLIIVLKYC